MNIWIVSPCYFDTDSFLQIRTQSLKALAESLKIKQVHFVLIDDSARRDPKAESDFKTLSDTRVIPTPYNMGSQSALVYGLRHLSDVVAPEDYIITMDSDGEDKPEDIGSMLAPLLAKKNELQLISLAWRTTREKNIAFKLLYFIFKCGFYVLTGVTIRNGNFTAFRGWFLKKMIFHRNFDQCYASTFISLRLNKSFVPLARGHRLSGESKISYTGLITHGLKMLLPFAEKIATRGIILFSLLWVVLLGWCGFLFASHSHYLEFSAFLFLLASLFDMIFVLIFVVDANFKSLSLGSIQRPHEHLDVC